MPKKTTPKSLALLAREGRWEDALRGLSGLSDAGDGAAAASTAELLAAMDPAQVFPVELLVDPWLPRS